MKSYSIVLIFACLGFLLAEADAQSQSRGAKPSRQLTLGPVVRESSQVSMDKLDHSSWNSLLQKYVDEAGGVDYAAWKSSPADYAALDQYISILATASLNQQAEQVNQKAYWINAYNAVTVKGILQEFPTTSIRNHTSKIPGRYNIWNDLLLNVGGHQVSLDAMEHKVLRPMGDPRIHFAIVCASKGCPRLLNQAYVGETLDEQLNLNATHFFSLPQNFQHDARRRTFKLSSIMEWFGKDFGQDRAAQLKAISPYLPTREAQAAANANDVRVSFLDYSWELNSRSGTTSNQGRQTRGGSQTRGSNRR